MHRALFAVVFVLGCADDVTPVVLQNISYTTNIYPRESSEPTPATSTSIEQDEPPPPPPLPPPPPQRVARDSPAVGVASCDRYLERAETCSLRILARSGSSSDAPQRITGALDTTRRAWRRAIAQGGDTMRANLAASCTDMLRQYESSTASWCAE